MTFPAPTVETPNCQLNWDFLQNLFHTGTGSPNGRVQAPVGSIYLRKDGTPGNTFYVKESGGTGNTGWVAK